MMTQDFISRLLTVQIPGSTIFRGIAPSLEELSPYLRDRVKHYVALYKEFIRPVMINGRAFHHTPFLPLAEETPWCVLEYARSDRSAAVGAVFRTSDGDGSEYTFKPRGLDPSQDYQVALDGAGLCWTVSGWVLMQDGIRVHLERAQTSELLLFRAAHAVLAAAEMEAPSGTSRRRAQGSSRRVKPRS